MIAETRTTKALRNVVFALTLTLTGATSMTNSSVAQGHRRALIKWIQAASALTGMTASGPIATYCSAGEFGR
jgi:hypothetical protein